MIPRHHHHRVHDNGGSQADEASRLFDEFCAANTFQVIVLCVYLLRKASYYQCVSVLCMSMAIITVNCVNMGLYACMDTTSYIYVLLYAVLCMIK